MKAATQEYHADYYQKNKSKWKEYSKRDYEKRKEEIAIKRSDPERRAKLSAYLKEWRERNADKKKKDMREWAINNRDHINEYRKKYRARRLELYKLRSKEISARTCELAKTEKYKERINRYKRTKRATNVQYMLMDRMRAALNRSLRRNWVKKSKRTMQLVGCTPTELKSHIESLFMDGMSWDNRKLWHVDHIRPIASFDLSDPEQQKQCFHYSNLQPLWALDNHQKSDKWAATFS